MLGVAAELIECFGLKIGEIRMLAQDRQFAGCNRPRGSSFSVRRHAGHHHLKFAYHRRKLDAGASQEPQSAALAELIPSQGAPSKKGLEQIPAFQTTARKTRNRRVRLLYNFR